MEDNNKHTQHNASSDDKTLIAVQNQVKKPASAKSTDAEICFFNSKLF